MSDRTKVQNARPTGVSGVSHFGGQVWNPWERDRAWIGLEKDRTINEMVNDPVVGSILFGIEMLVRRVDWSLQAADDSPEAADYATFVEQCLEDMDGHWPGDTLAQVLTFLGWGWACLELTYKQRLGRKPGNMPPSTYDDGRIGWKSWMLLPQLTRAGWEFDQNDVTALIQQDPMTFRQHVVPVDKCLLFRYASRDNSPEGNTALRVAFDAWYYKRQIQRIEAVGIERDLAGLPVMYIPGDEIENNTSVYTSAQALVMGIRQDTQAGAVIAGDRDPETGHRKQELELLSSGGSRAFDTDTVIRRYANEIVTSFLANVMRAGQDNVGSLSLSATQSNLFQQSIGAHLDTIADVIFEQAIVPLMEVNGFDPKLAPKLVPGDIEAANLERLGQYILNLANAGMLSDTPDLRAFVHKVAGLPVPSKEELEAQMETDQYERDLNRGAFGLDYRTPPRPDREPGQGEDEREVEGE